MIACMITQYCAGDASEGRPGALEESATTGGKPVFDFNDSEGFLQAVFPMTNARNFLGKNCMQCHEGPENAVPGAVSLHVSLKAMQAELRLSLAARARGGGPHASAPRRDLCRDRPHRLAAVG